jgi:chaperonin GroES
LKGETASTELAELLGRGRPVPGCTWVREVGFLEAFFILNTKTAAGAQPRPRVKEKRSMAATSVTTTFTPLHDRILVRRLEETETVRGGIIIPDSAKEKPQEGEVISVGKGKSNDEGKVFPLDVKAGDRILFGKYSGTEIKIDGEEYLIMREEEVLGIIKK